MGVSTDHYAQMSTDTYRCACKDYFHTDLYLLRILRPQICC